MSKLLNKIKSWWDIPKKSNKEIIISSYKFSPKEDITAYELYICQHRPIICISNDTSNNTSNEYQIKIDEWYNSLPNNCKRHFTSFQQTIIRL